MSIMSIEELKYKIKRSEFFNVYKRYYWKYVYPMVLHNAQVINSKPLSLGISLEKYYMKKKIIVSLTSFPERIPYLHNTLYSLLNQTLKPNLLVLYLSEKQFLNKDISLPRKITELQDLGLKIVWEKDDIKSYKKLLPALRDYPDDIIVTADDDLYYPSNWLESLVRSYDVDNNYIHCHLVTFVKMNSLREFRFEDSYGLEGNGTASFMYKILGGAGTLFPPRLLHNDVLDVNKCMDIAPDNDDLWYWIMAIRNNTKIKWIRYNMKRLYYVEHTQEETPCLYSVNNIGPNKRLIQLKALFEYYNMFN